MSHSNALSDHPVTRDHPGFCSPDHCEVTDVDVHHRSAPIELNLRDATLHLSWVSTDEFAFPAEPGSPELRVYIEHSMEGEDSTVYLGSDEIGKLTGQLTAEYFRLKFLVGVR